MRGAATSSRVTTLVVLGICVIAAIAATLLDLLVLPEHPDPPLSAGWSGVLPGIAMLVPGSLLLWRLPWHPIALLLSGFGMLWILDGLASAAVNYAWYFDRDAWWGPPGLWFFSRLGSLLLVANVLLLVLFPSGRLRRGWRRPLSIAAIALSLVMPFTYLLVPSEILNADIDDRTGLIAAFDPTLAPLPLPNPVWQALLDSSRPCILVAMLLALVVVISGRFGASELERAQLRWLVWSGLLFVLTIAFVFPYVPTVVVDILLAVAIGLVSVSVIIAVTRYRLYEIDRLLSWTIVYGLLIGGIVGVDVLLVLAVGNAIDNRVAMLLAVVMVTVIYAPLRDRLFSLASRFVNGRRGDPYSVVSSLGERLDRSSDTQTQLTHLAAAIAEAFASPYVRVELDRPGGAPIFAEAGASNEATIELPITQAGVAMGFVRMAPGRRPVSSSRDQQLLSDLVRLSVASLRNAEMGRELQVIRERLVLAREAERSRLRRELHDGLGPLLGGVKLRLEAARNWIERDPARAVGPLDAAIAEQTSVIDEIRRIVHDLRPPALDDLGLLGALKQIAARFSDGRMTAEVRGALPAALPPAVEVAAYRIVSEALTNAARHSGADSVTAELGFDERFLHLEVRDDGGGIRDDAVPGVGRRSMHERAVELGGTLEILPAEGGGTVVRAALPLAHEGTSAHAGTRDATTMKEAQADV